jgi:hypothetical protein
LFAGCSRRELRTLEQLSTRLHFRSGATISRDGDNGHEVVIVCRGTVVVDTPGRPMVSAPPGDVVATLAPPQQAPERTQTTLHALTDCDLLVSDRREHAALAIDAPDVAHRIATTPNVTDVTLSATLHRPLLASARDDCRPTTEARIA